MNKKGLFILDLVIVLIMITAFAVSSIIAYRIYTDFRETAAPSLETNNNVTSEVMGHTEDVLQSFDYIFLVLLIGLTIGVIISVTFIKTHPVFFIVTLFLLIVAIILAAQFSNIFYEIRTAPDLQNASSNYTIIPTVMDKLPLIALIIGAIILVYLFAKARSGM
jgi:F0F1-type ATP synthase assembly protein I